MGGRHCSLIRKREKLCQIKTEQDPKVRDRKTVMEKGREVGIVTEVARTLALVRER
jgi:hypothetical protein